MLSHTWSFWSMAPMCSLWGLLERALGSTSIIIPGFSTQSITLSIAQCLHLCMRDQFLQFLLLASFCIWVRTVLSPIITGRGFITLHVLFNGSRNLFYSTAKVIHEQGWNMTLISIQTELKTTADSLLSLSERKGWGEATGLSYGSCFLDWNGIPESEVLWVSTVLMMLQSHILNIFWGFMLSSDIFHNVAEWTGPRNEVTHQSNWKKWELCLSKQYEPAE